MEQKIKGLLKGTVVSDKPAKSAVVKVDTRKSHPEFKKRIIYSKKYMIHDEKNECRVGDLVEIIPSRPHSKRKKFCLSRILKTAEKEVES